MRLGVSLVVVVSLGLLGLWASTEYVAGQLDYAPELGPPWMVVHGTRIYAPWGWVEWIDDFTSRGALDVFRAVLLVEFTGAAAFLFGAVVGATRTPPAAPDGRGEE